MPEKNQNSINTTKGYAIFWKQFKVVSPVRQLPKYRDAKGEKLLILPKCPRNSPPPIPICMSELKTIPL